jgi:hypothetical protein
LVIVKYPPIHQLSPLKCSKPIIYYNHAGGVL